MPWQYSVRTHLIIALALCVLLTAVLWWLLSGHRHAWQLWLGNWLLAVNLVTFGYYGLDKYLAKFVIFRIPEVVLHTLSAVGGSPAALLAMWFFRHKTIKDSFRVLFWSIVAVQVVVSAYIVKVLWWD